MRFFGRLLAVAATSTLCISSMNGWNHAEAACVSHPGTVSDGTPDTDALTMFVTTTSVTNGDIPFSASDLGLAGGTGLASADQICTFYASQSTYAKSTYNRNAGGGTVQFTALLSTVGVSAIDRFTAVNSKNIKNSNKLGEECIATSILDLFQSGYNLNDRIKTENGDAASGNQGVWTGTGIFVSGSPSTSTADKHGGTFHAAGQTGTFSASSYQCNNWAAASGPSGITGIIGVSTNPGPNQWIQQAEAGDNCASAFSLYCISSQPFQAPTQPPGGNGDPQFVGLQGQQFQVHGMPEEFFNLITTPTFQLNSRFAYLASGTCNYNNTECWTHPGTYVDQLGFMFPGLTIKAIAGTHDDGMTVYVNEKRITSSTSATHHTIHSHHHHQDINSTQIVTIIHTQQDKLIVQAPLFTITATNSDMFFNFGVSLHSPSLLSAGSSLRHINDKSGSSDYPSFPLHGLLGQTWKNARYQHGRMFAGTVDDYMLLDSKLISTKFVYNQYKH